MFMNAVGAYMVITLWNSYDGNICCSLSRFRSSGRRSESCGRRRRWRRRRESVERAGHSWDGRSGCIRREAREFTGRPPLRRTRTTQRPNCRLCLTSLWVYCLRVDGCYGFKWTLGTLLKDTSQWNVHFFHQIKL